MPGLIGVIGSINDTNFDEVFMDMADAIKHENWYHTDTYVGDGVRLGRVSLGLINPGSQPIWNEDKTICIFMEGEIYNAQDLKTDLLKRGHRFQDNNGVEVVLHLFEEYGEDFAIRLNGAFIAAIWDQRTHKLLLVNDRLGLHPLYYARHMDSFAFASGVGALLSIPGFCRSLDKVAIAQFLTFDHVLGQRTFLSEVQLLPQASILIYRDKSINLKSYWSPTYPENYQLIREEELMEKLIFLCRQAVNRQASDNLNAGVLLSGGLDSRVLLTLLRDVCDAGSLKSFTFGIPGCDDVRFAQELSKKLGVRHYFFELEPDWLLQHAEKAVRITDGLGNIVNLHALANLDQETGYANILYKGFLGDALLGFAIRHQFLADYDDATQMQAHYQVHSDQGVITFDLPEQKLLFNDLFQREVGNSVIETYQAGMRESGSRLLSDQRIFFDIKQRVPRMTINGVEVVRSKAVVRLPFCDNDLVEFALTIPPGLRYERRIMRDAFIMAYPQYAKVPLTPSGLPMIDCGRDILIRTERLVRWHLKRAGLSWVRYPGQRPYKDYNKWFRTVLRQWLEELLLSKRAINRDLFNPKYVRQIVDDHMHGANHAVKLGALLTIELWHQQFID